MSSGPSGSPSAPSGKPRTFPELVKSEVDRIVLTLSKGQSPNYDAFSTWMENMVSEGKLQRDRLPNRDQLKQLFSNRRHHGPKVAPEIRQAAQQKAKKKRKRQMKDDEPSDDEAYAPGVLSRPRREPTECWTGKSGISVEPEYSIGRLEHDVAEP